MEANYPHLLQLLLPLLLCPSLLKRPLFALALLLLFCCVPVMLVGLANIPRLVMSVWGGLVMVRVRVRVALRTHGQRRPLLRRRRGQSIKLSCMLHDCQRDWRAVHAVATAVAWPTASAAAATRAAAAATTAAWVDPAATAAALLLLLLLLLTRWCPLLLRLLLLSAVLARLLRLL